MDWSYASNSRVLLCKGKALSSNPTSTNSKIKGDWSGMETPTCNPRIWETEADKSRIQSHPELCSKNVRKEKRGKKREKGD
jgi:hypothetical protein